jgi:2'-5' RNA ligase superfamily
MRSSIDLHFSGLISVLDGWRMETVAVAQRGVPPHISLLYPWRNAPLLESDLDSLRLILNDIKPFELCFDRLEIFDPGVLYLALEDDIIIRQLMNELYKAFPDTPPYGGAFVDPIPHLTVAKGTLAEVVELKSVVSEKLALPFKILISEIVVMEESETGQWSNRYVYNLED